MLSDRGGTRGAAASARRRAKRPALADHLIVAPLGVAFQANLGTLLRTCDEVGACIAGPDTPHYRQALSYGDTLGPRRHPCIHWVRTCKERWIEQQRADGWHIVAVEPAERAIALPRLEPRGSARSSCMATSGMGVPEEQVDAGGRLRRDRMVGRGVGLNVAVAGSLVLYRLVVMRDAGRVRLGAPVQSASAKRPARSLR